MSGSCGAKYTRIRTGLCCYTSQSNKAAIVHLCVHLCTYVAHFQPAACVCLHVRADFVGVYVGRSLVRTWGSLFLPGFGNWSCCFPLAVSVCGACLRVQAAYTSKLCQSRRLTYAGGRSPSLQTVAMKDQLCSYKLPITPREKERMSGTCAFRITEKMQKCLCIDYNG